VRKKDVAAKTFNRSTLNHSGEIQQASFKIHPL
jgi:hypothetical protein